ncbi:hypothetical protein Aduo_011080 [Ancylostoma duodenale]
MEGGCLRAQLVAPLRLRISSLHPYSESHSKSGPRRGSSPVDHATVENTELVPSRIGSRRERSNVDSQALALGHGSRGESSSALKAGELPPYCMENLAKIWRREGYSNEAVGIIMASWSKNTQDQYNTCLINWVKFARDTCYDLTPTPTSLCNYLAYLHGKPALFAH